MQALKTTIQSLPATLPSPTHHPQQHRGEDHLDAHLEGLKMEVLGILFHHLRWHTYCCAICWKGCLDHGTSTKNGIFTYRDLVNEFHSCSAINAFFNRDFARKRV